MAARERVKLLIPIWGARYIEEFARIAMPFHLAEGNLPHLAAETDLEVLILTTQASQTILDNEPVIAKLRSFCGVRFIFIDDILATQDYGVILTLAYARGIADSGAEQTNTYFVFMNSDFILADGAMRELVSQLKAGHPCVMAPSLRACTESVLEPLMAMAGPDGVARAKSRDMVALAMSAPHPTVVGKTVTQNIVASMQYNQIYWKVDDHTVLARYHLIFMLAIKPEVPIGPVNSYCDYGFVPELVPSGRLQVLSDSDSFFMLELQPLAQERHMVRIGTATPAEIAAELSTWTTREHRGCAKFDIVFRTGDLPDTLPDARGRLATFMAEIERYMSPEPITHVDHHYWTGGVRSWASVRYYNQGGDYVLPPEIGQPAFLERRPPAQRWTALRRFQQSYLRWRTLLAARSAPSQAAGPLDLPDPAHMEAKRMWALQRLGETDRARSWAQYLRRRQPNELGPHVVLASTESGSMPSLVVSPALSVQIEATVPTSVASPTCRWDGKPLQAQTLDDGRLLYTRPGESGDEASWTPKIDFVDGAGQPVRGVSARLVVDLRGVTDAATGDFCLSPENVHYVERTEDGAPSHRWTGPDTVCGIRVPVWVQDGDGLCALTIYNTGVNAMGELKADLNGKTFLLSEDQPGWIDGSTIELPLRVSDEAFCEILLRSPRTEPIGSDRRKIGVAWGRARLTLPLRLDDSPGPS